MLRDEIVAWLRQNATVTADAGKVIGLLCKLREGLVAAGARKPVKRQAAIFEVEELRQILLAPEKLRTRLVFRVQFSTMTRIGEVRRLLKADFFERGRIFIRGAKGDFDRYVLMDPGTYAAVLAWIEGEPLTRRLFELTNEMVQQNFKQVCRDLGLLEKYEVALGLRCVPHGFRHNGATHCHAREMPVDYLETLLGHSKLDTTAIYTQMSVATCRERYMGTRREPPTTFRAPLRPRGKAWDRESLERVIEFIMTHLPATADLDEVIRALCRHCLEGLSRFAQEFVGEMMGEVSLEDLLRGFRLPVVLSPEDLSLLIGAPDDLLDSTLYAVLAATGMRGEEALRLVFSDLDPAEQTVRVADRRVIADPDTFERLKRWQGDKDPGARIFPVKLAEAERRLQTWADRTGIGERYRAMGRTATLRLFRHAFGSHRFEAGMDILTLKLLMGHAYSNTTLMYPRTAVGRFRSEYLRCHPLANGAIDLPPEESGP